MNSKMENPPSAPFPPSQSLNFPASAASNMNAWGPTKRENVRLPSGPYPTIKSQFGSEHFYGPRQKLSKMAMIVLGIALILILICLFCMLRKKSSPAFYYF